MGAGQGGAGVVRVADILGLPGEGVREALDTIRAAGGLGSDYASFNAFSPRPGSELYNTQPDEARKRPFVGNMLRLAYASFYSRPGFIANYFRKTGPRKVGTGTARSVFHLAKYLVALPDVRNGGSHGLPGR